MFFYRNNLQIPIVEYIYIFFIFHIGGSIISLFLLFFIFDRKAFERKWKIEKKKKERRQESNRTEAWLFKADVIEIGNRIFSVILFFFILLSRVSYLNPSPYTENITVHDCIEHKINMKYSLTSGILNKMQIEI